MMTAKGTILDIINSGEKLSEGEKKHLQKIIDETECNIEVRIEKKELEELKSSFRDTDNDKLPIGMLVLSDDEVVYFRFTIL